MKRQTISARTLFFAISQLLVNGAFAAVFSSTTTTADASFANARDSTHEVVCECECGDEIQTYEWVANHACSRYEGIECEFNGGSSSKLAACTKKARPKDNQLARIGNKVALLNLSSRSVPVNQLSIATIQKYPMDATDFDIPDGDAYQAWLDEISYELFGGTFPGLLLSATPGNAGQSYAGRTAIGGSNFLLYVTKIDELELTRGYVDPNSALVYNLKTVWLRGSISAGSTVVQVEGIVSTATEVGGQGNTLTAFLPLNGMYPFTPTNQFSLSNDDFLDDLGSNPMLDTGLLDFSMKEGGEDACQGCKNVWTKKIKSMKKSLKRCLFWTGAASVVSVFTTGGLATVVVAGVGAGYCADTAIDETNEIHSDFCKCLKKNDCGEDPICPNTK